MWRHIFFTPQRCLTADMLSAVKEYQGLRPVNITGVRDPYLCIIEWHIR